MVQEGIEYDKKISKDAVKVAIDRVIPFLLLILQKFMNFYIYFSDLLSSSFGTGNISVLRTEVEKKVTSRYLESIASKVSALLLLVANIRQGVSSSHNILAVLEVVIQQFKSTMMSYWVHSQIWVCYS